MKLSITLEDAKDLALATGAAACWGFAPVGDDPDGTQAKSFLRQYIFQLLRGAYRQDRINAASETAAAQCDTEDSV